jgi:hypothetical protein
VSEAEPRRRFDVGPGFVRARECPDCGHTRCGDDCTCNCDAAHAEHEAAALRKRLDGAGDEVSKLFVESEALRAEVEGLRKKDEVPLQDAVAEMIRRMCMVGHRTVWLRSEQSGAFALVTVAPETAAKIHAVLEREGLLCPMDLGKIGEPWAPSGDEGT